MIEQATLKNFLTCIIAVIIFIFQTLNYFLTWIKKFVNHENEATTNTVVTADTTKSSDSKPNDNNALEDFIRVQELIQKHFDIPLTVAEDDPKVESLIQNTQSFSNTPKDNHEFVDQLNDDSYVARGIGLIAAFIGREAEFYIYSKYDYNFENIVVELKGRDGETGKTTISNRNHTRCVEPKSIPIDYIYDEDRIKVTYTPFTEGVHTLTLLRNGLSICRSPYFISVDKSPSNSRSRIRLGTKKYRIMSKFGKSKSLTVETKDTSNPVIIETGKPTVTKDVLPASQENYKGADVMSIVTKFESKNKGLKKKLPMRMSSITERSHESDSIENLVHFTTQSKIGMTLGDDTDNNNVKVPHEKFSELKNVNSTKTDNKYKKNRFYYEDSIQVDNNQRNKAMAIIDEIDEKANDILMKENLSSTKQKFSSKTLVNSSLLNKNFNEKEYEQTSVTNKLKEQNNVDLIIDQSMIHNTVTKFHIENKVMHSSNRSNVVLIKKVDELESNLNVLKDQQITKLAYDNSNPHFSSIITQITNEVCEKCSKKLQRILLELPKDINITYNTNSYEIQSKVDTPFEKSIRNDINIDGIIEDSTSNEHNENLHSHMINNSTILKHINLTDKNINRNLLNEIESFSIINSEDQCKETSSDTLHTELTKFCTVNQNDTDVNNIAEDNTTPTELAKEQQEPLKVFNETLLQKISTNKDISINPNTVIKNVVNNNSEIKIEESIDLNTLNSVKPNIDLTESNHYDENVDQEPSYNTEELISNSDTNELSIIINNNKNTNKLLYTDKSKLVEDNLIPIEYSNVQNCTTNDIELDSAGEILVTREENKETDHDRLTSNGYEKDNRRVTLAPEAEINQKRVIEKSIEPVLNSFKNEVVERILQLCLNENLPNTNSTLEIEVTNNKEEKNQNDEILMTHIENYVDKSEIPANTLDSLNSCNLLKFIEHVVEKNMIPKENNGETITEMKFKKTINSAIHHPHNQQSENFDCNENEKEKMFAKEICDVLETNNAKIIIEDEPLSIGEDKFDIHQTEDINTTNDLGVISTIQQISSPDDVKTKELRNTNTNHQKTTSNNPMLTEIELETKTAMVDKLNVVEINNLSNAEKFEDDKTPIIEMKTIIQTELSNISELEIKTPNLKNIETIETKIIPNDMETVEFKNINTLDTTVTTDIRALQISNVNNSFITKRENTFENETVENTTISDFNTKVVAPISDDTENIAIEMSAIDTPTITDIEVKEQKDTREVEISQEVYNIDFTQTITTKKENEIELPSSNKSEFDITENLNLDDLKPESSILISNYATVTIEIKTTPNTRLTNAIVTLAVKEPNTAVIDNNTSNNPTLSKSQVLALEEPNTVEIENPPPATESCGSKNVTLELKDIPKKTLLNVSDTTILKQKEIKTIAKTKDLCENNNIAVENTNKLNIDTGYIIESPNSIENELKDKINLTEQTFLTELPISSRDENMVENDLKSKKQPFCEYELPPTTSSSYNVLKNQNTIKESKLIDQVIVVEKPKLMEERVKSNSPKWNEEIILGKDKSSSLSEIEILSSVNYSKSNENKTLLNTSAIAVSNTTETAKEENTIETVPADIPLHDIQPSIEESKAVIIETKPETMISTATHSDQVKEPNVVDIHDTFELSHTSHNMDGAVENSKIEIETVTADIISHDNRLSKEETEEEKTKTLPETEISNINLPQHVKLLNDLNTEIRCQSSNTSNNLEKEVENSKTEIETVPADIITSHDNQPSIGKSEEVIIETLPETDISNVTFHEQIEMPIHINTDIICKSSNTSNNLNEVVGNSKKEVETVSANITSNDNQSSIEDSKEVNIDLLSENIMSNDSHTDLGEKSNDVNTRIICESLNTRHNLDEAVENSKIEIETVPADITSHDNQSSIEESKEVNMDSLPKNKISTDNLSKLGENPYVVDTHVTFESSESSSNQDEVVENSKKEVEAVTMDIPSHDIQTSTNESKEANIETLPETVIFNDTLSKQVEKQNVVDTHETYKSSHTNHNLDEVVENSKIEIETVPIDITSDNNQLSIDESEEERIETIPKTDISNVNLPEQVEIPNDVNTSIICESSNTSHNLDEVVETSKIEIETVPADITSHDNQSTIEESKEVNIDPLPENMISNDNHSDLEEIPNDVNIRIICESLNTSHNLNEAVENTKIEIETVPADIITSHNNEPPIEKSEEVIIETLPETDTSNVNLPEQVEIPNDVNTSIIYKSSNTSHHLDDAVENSKTEIETVPADIITSQNKQPSKEKSEEVIIDPLPETNISNVTLPEQIEMPIDNKTDIICESPHTSNNLDEVVGNSKKEVETLSTNIPTHGTQPIEIKESKEVIIDPLPENIISNDNLSDLVEKPNDINTSIAFESSDSRSNSDSTVLNSITEVETVTVNKPSHDTQSSSKESKKASIETLPETVISNDTLSEQVEKQNVVDTHDAFESSHTNRNLDQVVENSKIEIETVPADIITSHDNQPSIGKSEEVIIETLPETDISNVTFHEQIEMPIHINTDIICKSSNTSNNLNEVVGNSKKEVETVSANITSNDNQSSIEDSKEVNIDPLPENIMSNDSHTDLGEKSNDVNTRIICESLNTNHNLDEVVENSKIEIETVPVDITSDNNQLSIDESEEERIETIPKTDISNVNLPEQVEIPNDVNTSIICESSNTSHNLDEGVETSKLEIETVPADITSHDNQSTIEESKEVNIDPLPENMISNDNLSDLEEKLNDVNIRIICESLNTSHNLNEAVENSKIEIEKVPADIITSHNKQPSKEKSEEVIIETLPETNISNVTLPEQIEMPIDNKTDIICESPHTRNNLDEVVGNSKKEVETLSTNIPTHGTQPIEIKESKEVIIDPLPENIISNDNLSDLVEKPNDINTSIAFESSDSKSNSDSTVSNSITEVETVTVNKPSHDTQSSSKESKKASIETLPETIISNDTLSEQVEKQNVVDTHDAFESSHTNRNLDQVVENSKIEIEIVPVDIITSHNNEPSIEKSEEVIIETLPETDISNDNLSTQVEKPSVVNTDIALETSESSSNMDKTFENSKNKVGTVSADIPSHDTQSSIEGSKEVIIEILPDTMISNDNPSDLGEKPNDVNTSIICESSNTSHNLDDAVENSITEIETVPADIITSHDNQPSIGKSEEVIVEPLPETDKSNVTLHEHIEMPIDINTDILCKSPNTSKYNLDEVEENSKKEVKTVSASIPTNGTQPTIKESKEMIIENLPATVISNDNLSTQGKKPNIVDTHDAFKSSHTDHYLDEAVENSKKEVGSVSANIISHDNLSSIEDCKEVNIDPLPENMISNDNHIDLGEKPKDVNTRIICESLNTSHNLDEAVENSKIEIETVPADITSHDTQSSTNESKGASIGTLPETVILNDTLFEQVEKQNIVDTHDAFKSLNTSHNLDKAEENYKIGIETVPADIISDSNQLLIEESEEERIETIPETEISNVNLPEQVEIPNDIYTDIISESSNTSHILDETVKNSKIESETVSVKIRSHDNQPLTLESTEVIIEILPETMISNDNLSDLGEKPNVVDTHDALESSHTNHNANKAVENSKIEIKTIAVDIITSYDNHPSIDESKEVITEKLPETVISSDTLSEQVEMPIDINTDIICESSNTSHDFGLVVENSKNDVETVFTNTPSHSTQTLLKVSKDVTIENLAESGISNDNLSEQVEKPNVVNTDIAFETSELSSNLDKTFKISKNKVGTVSAVIPSHGTQPSTKESKEASIVTLPETDISNVTLPEQIEIPIDNKTDIICESLHTSNNLDEVVGNSKKEVETVSANIPTHGIQTSIKESKEVIIENLPASVISNDNLSVLVENPNVVDTHDAFESSHTNHNLDEVVENSKIEIETVPADIITSHNNEPSIEKSKEVIVENLPETVMANDNLSDLEEKLNVFESSKTSHILVDAVENSKIELETVSVDLPSHDTQTLMKECKEAKIEILPQTKISYVTLFEQEEIPNKIKTGILYESSNTSHNLEEVVENSEIKVEAVFADIPSYDTQPSIEEFKEVIIETLSETEILNVTLHEQVRKPNIVNTDCEYELSGSNSNLDVTVDISKLKVESVSADIQSHGTQSSIESSEEMIIESLSETMLSGDTLFKQVEKPNNVNIGIAFESSESSDNKEDSKEVNIDPLPENMISNDSHIDLGEKPNDVNTRIICESLNTSHNLNEAVENSKIDVETGSADITSHDNQPSIDESKKGIIDNLPETVISNDNLSDLGEKPNVVDTHVTFESSESSSNQDEVVENSKIEVEAVSLNINLHDTELSSKVSKEDKIETLSKNLVNFDHFFEPENINIAMVDESKIMTNINTFDRLISETNHAVSIEESDEAKVNELEEANIISEGTNIQIVGNEQKVIEIETSNYPILIDTVDRIGGIKKRKNETVLMSDVDTKCIDKLNDVIISSVIEKEISDVDSKNENAENLNIQIEKLNESDSSSKYGETSKQIFSGNENDSQEKSYGSQKFEMSVQRVKSFEDDYFEKTFIQLEQTETISAVSKSSNDIENNTTIVNESDLNAILCASSLQEALTLLDAKIKFKFKHHTRKSSSRITSAVYKENMETHANHSNSGEKSAKFTEAQEFFKKIEENSKK